MNELEQFLGISEDETTTEEDILTQPLSSEPEKDEEEEEEETTEEVEEEEEDDELKPKNRRERRLMRKLQEEKDSSIFLAGRLEAQEEAKKLLSNEEADYLEGIKNIYGTESPEAILATELLTKAIVGARDDAENRAYSRIQTERQNETQAVQEAEFELDSIIEDIEDNFDIELTPGQQKAYFELLQKMSPKDQSGEVTSLADPYAVYELFSERLKKPEPDNRAKKLSSRSMTQSGASKDSNINDDVAERYLKESGII